MASGEDPSTDQTPEVYEIELTDVAFGGDAIGRLDGEVVFVPFGLPGERVAVALEARKRDYAWARIVEVLEPSPHRTAAPCPYFGQCGGCQLQHATYPQQLTLKRQVVIDQLRRIGGFTSPEDWVSETIGMVTPWEYRNHARFSLGKKYGDVGYTYRASHRLLRVDHCPISLPTINEILATVQRRCAGLRAHQITVRYGSNTGALLVNPALPMVPELDTGQRRLEEEVLDRRFQISAASFFQVNTRRERRPLPEAISSKWAPREMPLVSMADILALLVLDRLNPTGQERLVDAYSGVGTFAALLSPHAAEVVGIEESRAAVHDAEANTAGLDNVRLLAGRTEDVLPNLQGGIDGVVLDPSRVGCAREVLDGLLALRPPRVVYVSCDPATLARDLKLLSLGGYAVERVEPVDMFPQTYHIETVTTLRLAE